LCVGLVPGCAYPEASFDSPDPGALIPAILKAAEHRDPEAIPRLIQCLDHDDPAVRFAAIRALERITGQTLGYDFAAPERERRERVEAWVKWQESRTGVGGAGRPVANAGEGGRR
jgi:hypothetical protein